MYLVAEAAIDFLWRAGQSKDTQQAADKVQQSPGKKNAFRQTSDVDPWQEPDSRVGPRGPLYADPSSRLLAAQRPPSAQPEANWDRAQKKQKRQTRLRIPQTAVFCDGVLTGWYFMSGGKIRRKHSKSLEMSNFLREFITEAKPGQPVALLICSKKGDDGLTTTCSSVLHEAAFTRLVKNAFSDRMNCMLQEYVIGQITPEDPWVISDAPDPRNIGLGWLEATWSPSFLEVTLRAESELSAVSHEIREKLCDGIGAETRMSKPRVLLQKQRGGARAGAGHNKVEHDSDPYPHAPTSGSAPGFFGATQMSGADFVSDYSRDWVLPLRAQGSAFKRYPLSHGRSSAPPVLTAGTHGPETQHSQTQERWRSSYNQHRLSVQRSHQNLPAFGGVDYYRNGLGAVVTLQEREEIGAMCAHIASLVSAFNERAASHPQTGTGGPVNSPKLEAAGPEVQGMRASSACLEH
jgi:hypothetical protein